MGISAAIAGSAAAGLAGSAMSASASSSAADKQAAAARTAAANQVNEQNFINATLNPYVTKGAETLDDYGTQWQRTQNALDVAAGRVNAATPQPMTQENLIKTPGYQFNLSQGMRAIQNSAAAKGLGVSGAALQGAANYATGLADNTYQNQFNNQQTLYTDANQQYTNALNGANAVYNQLSGPVTVGENAAAQTGTTGVQSYQAAGNNLINAGIAQSAGITGAANNYASGLQSAGNSGLAYLGLKSALDSNSNPLPTSGQFTTAASNSPFMGADGSLANFGYGSN